MSKEPEVTPEEVNEPSFFIDNDTNLKISVDVIYQKKKNGKVLSITKTGTLNCPESLALKQEVFEFSVPNFENILTYRQMASEYSAQARGFVVDLIKFKNSLLIWHLKKWTLKDQKGKLVELKHDKNGALSDDSLKEVYKVSPILMEIVLDLFEKEISLAG